MNKIEEEDWTAKLIKIKSRLWWYSREQWENVDSVYLVLSQPIEEKYNRLPVDAVSFAAERVLADLNELTNSLPPGEQKYIFNCFSGGETFVFALKLREIEIMGEQ